MRSIDLLGWASSCILLLTIVWQIRRQWASGTSAGVSRWLFVGQIAASTGFTSYSWLVGNKVFVATNAALLVSAMVGLGIVLKHRRRERRGARRSSGQLVPGRPARVG